MAPAPARHRPVAAAPGGVGPGAGLRTARCRFQAAWRLANWRLSAAVQKGQAGIRTADCSARVKQQIKFSADLSALGLA